MRAPDRAVHSLDEIVHASVEKLATPEADSTDLDAIEVEVRAIFRTLRMLNSLNVPLWGYQAENAKALGRIRKGLEAALDTFADAPTVALLLLFAQEGEIRDEGVPTLDVQQKILNRMRGFLAGLRHRHRRTEHLADSKPGKHGNAGFRQELAATEAWDSLERHGKRPAYSGSEASVYHQLTSHFYEAMTGEADVDLTRACREVHKRKTLRPKKTAKRGFKTGPDT
jgi:hypothetical protein